MVHRFHGVREGQTLIPALLPDEPVPAELLDECKGKRKVVEVRNRTSADCG